MLLPVSVTQVFPLPVEGAETKVLADDQEVANYMIDLGDLLETVRGLLCSICPCWRKRTRCVKTNHFVACQVGSFPFHVESHVYVSAGSAQAFRTTYRMASFCCALCRGRRGRSGSWGGTTATPLTLRCTATASSRLRTSRRSSPGSEQKTLTETPGWLLW